MYKVNEYMNMTGFQNTTYGARTNRSYQSFGSPKNDTRLSEKSSQASFSKQQELFTNYDESSTEDNPAMAAEEIQEEVNLYKSELERYLFFQNAGRLRVRKEDEHVLFQTEKEKTGVFSDKTLAEPAGYKLDHEIDWESDGTGSLTEEQIQYLKGKYNVENLTETDYYNLLAELTEMNVLSGKDVEKQFVRQMPPCTAMVMPGYVDMDKEFAGNYLKRLQKELDETELILSMLRAGKCSVSPESSLESVRAFYEEEQEYRKKVAGIFQQLQRGTPKAAFASEKTES